MLHIPNLCSQFPYVVLLQYLSLLEVIHPVCIFHTSWKLYNLLYWYRSSTKTAVGKYIAS